VNTNVKEVALDLPIAATEVRSFYARVSGLGFGLIALPGIVVLIFGLLGGDAGGSLGFALVFLVVGLLVAGAVWRFGRWTLVLAALLSFALLGLIGPFSLFSLGHPESAADFVPIVLSLAGALLGFAGSVVALVQWRRGNARADGTRVERRVVRAMLGVVGMVVVLSMILSLTSHTVATTAAKTGATSVQIKNFAFVPHTLQVRAGDTVRLVIKNDDATLHTFTLPQAGVDVSMPPGSDKVVEFKAPASGVYQWFCIPHSSADGATRQGMVGTLQAQ
jgi:plastocyanin